MQGWGPDTPWRQGHILTTESLKALDIIPAAEDEEFVGLVTSHDCDLAHHDFAAEPDCEVIVGKVIDAEKIGGQYTDAKHPRRLHLSFTAGSVKICGDFLATQKRLIKKSDLGDVHKPCDVVSLTPDELSTLQRWLTARYKRATFPNEFNKRLGPLRDKIGKIIDKTDGCITAIYFSVDKNHDNERKGEDDIYELLIFLVKNSERSPDETSKAAVRARSELLDLFRSRFRKDGAWKNIELQEVFPTSDQEMTLRQSWRLREWTP